MPDEDPKTEETPAITVNSTTGTISIRTGTIIAVAGALLGTGGGTTLMTLFERPSPEVLLRLDEIERRLDAVDEIEAQRGPLINRISGIVMRVHKVTTTVDGIELDPDPDL